MCASWDGDGRPVDPDATGGSRPATLPCRAPLPTTGRDLDIPCRICRAAVRSGEARRARSTWHGSRSTRLRNPSTRPPETSATNPSTRPRWRLHTSSGWVSARSRKGQWVNATVAPSSVSTTAGSKPSVASRSTMASRHGGVARAAVAATLVAADLEGLLGGGAGVGGETEQQPGRQREQRRLEAQRGCLGRQRVAVLGATDPAPGVGVDLEQAHLPHPLEVGTDRVDVEAEAGRHLGGGAAAGATRASSR